MEKITYVTNEVYTCPYCGKTYDTIESAIKHMDTCWFNYQDNKFCITCKNLVEVKVAPYKGNNNDYELNLIDTVGPYDQLGCDKSMCQGYLKQDWLEEEHPDCYETFDRNKDIVLKEFTPGYVEFMELTIKAIEEDEELYNQLLASDDIKVVEDYDEYIRNLEEN